MEVEEEKKGKSKTIPVTVALVCIAAVLAYTLRPLKSTTKMGAATIIPGSFAEGRKISCEEQTSTSIFPKGNAGELPTEVESEIGKGHEHMALEIEGDSVKMLLGTTVEMGSIEPLIFTISGNNGNFLTAWAIEQASLGEILHTLAINKTSGATVWTKTVSAYLVEAPYSLTFFFSCK